MNNQIRLKFSKTAFSSLGFTFGLVSPFFFKWYGIVPFLAVVFGTIGLFRERKVVKNSIYQSLFGIIIGIVFLYQFIYLHI